MDAGVGRDRGGRPAGQPPHRRDPAQDAVREQQRRRRHDGQRRLVPRDSSPSTCSPASSTGIRALKIGWFEGGIAWVPTALQDAEHLLASYRHMFNHQLEHDVRYYWDNHMSASFMVDPLGLRADRRDRRGQRDVVVGLPAQREHVRLLGEVAASPSSTPSDRRTRSRSSAPTSRSSWASNDHVR